MIERGEALVRSLGFKVFRVRHLALEHETRARVLIAPEEMGQIEPVNELLVSGLRQWGMTAWKSTRRGIARREGRFPFF